MVSVSRDQSIRFWDLPNRRLAHVIELPSPAGNAQFCRSANLLAVETAGSEVIVVECASRQIIRRFRGDARAAGTCLAFAEDGRWLLFGDSRGDLRIWSVPESREKGREKTRRPLGGLGSLRARAALRGGFGERGIRRDDARGAARNRGFRQQRLLLGIARFPRTRPAHLHRRSRG